MTVSTSNPVKEAIDPNLGTGLDTNEKDDLSKTLIHRMKVQRELLAIISSESHSRGQAIQGSLECYFQSIYPNTRITRVRDTKKGLIPINDDAIELSRNNQPEIFKISQPDLDLIRAGKKINLKVIAGDSDIYLIDGDEYTIIKGIPEKEKPEVFTQLKDISGVYSRIYKKVQSSYVDELTGLGNSSDYKRVKNIIDNKPDSKYAVIAFDLSNFKRANDQFGHDKGDELLKDFADILKQTFKRATDFVFRPSGDEFIVIIMLPNNKDLESQKKIVRGRGAEMRTLLERYNSETLPKKDMKGFNELWTTYGLAYKEEHETVDDVFRRADSGLTEWKSGDGSLNRLAGAAASVVGGKRKDLRGAVKTVLEIILKAENHSPYEKLRGIGSGVSDVAKQTVGSIQKAIRNRFLKLIGKKEVTEKGELEKGE